MTDIETRVGYRTISVLKKEIEKYIKAFTVDDKYEGELGYLIMYQKCVDLLKK